MRKKQITLLAVLAILALVIIVGIVVKGQLDKNLQDLTKVTVADISVSELPDGTYEGGYSSFPVTAKVQVRISDGKITGIDLVEHNNGQGQSAESLPASVVASQSLSEALISAVCLYTF